MSERLFDIVALGEAMVEFNQQGHEHYQAGFGGDTSNCAIAAARLGARTAYVTQLGEDVFGEQLLEPGYEQVERIAAVGLTVTRNG